MYIPNCIYRYQILNTLWQPKKHGRFPESRGTSNFGGALVGVRHTWLCGRSTVQADPLAMNNRHCPRPHDY